MNVHSLSFDAEGFRVPDLPSGCVRKEWHSSRRQSKRQTRQLDLPECARFSRSVAVQVSSWNEHVCTSQNSPDDIMKLHFWYSPHGLCLLVKCESEMTKGSLTGLGWWLYRFVCSAKGRIRDYLNRLETWDLHVHLITGWSLTFGLVRHISCAHIKWDLYFEMAHACVRSHIFLIAWSF